MIHCRGERHRHRHPVALSTVQPRVGRVHITWLISVDHVVLADQRKTLTTGSRWDGPAKQTLEKPIPVVHTTGTIGTIAAAGITLTVLAHTRTVTTEPVSWGSWVVDGTVRATVSVLSTVTVLATVTG